MPPGPAARARLLPGLAAPGRPPPGRPAPAAAPRLTGLLRTPHPLSLAPPRPAPPDRCTSAGLQRQAALTHACPRAEPLGVSPSPRAASSANPGAGRAAAPFVRSREGGPVGMRTPGRHSGRPPGRALQPPGRERRTGPLGCCWLIPRADFPGGWECFPPRSPACAQPFTPGSQNRGGQCSSARVGSSGAGRKAGTLGLGGEACNSPQ